MQTVNASGSFDMQHIDLKPFYGIAHHCNTIEGMLKALKFTNAIECDITPDWPHDQIRFSVFHEGDNIGYYLPRFFTCGQAGYDGPTSHYLFDEYLRVISANIQSKKLALVIFDLKLHEFDDNELKLNLVIAEFLNQLKKHRIPEELVVVTVKAKMAKKVFAVFDDLKSRCFRDITFDPIDVLPKPSYLPPSEWFAALHDVRASFAGFGIDSHVVHSPMQDWLMLAKEFVAERDKKDSSFKKIYYWTLAKEEHTLAILKTGVDGIIHDDVKLLTKLLTTHFADTLRLATQDDTRRWHAATVLSQIDNPRPTLKTMVK